MTAWRARAVALGLGGFALVAQTLLFRAYVSSFEHHAIGVGAFFFAWLAWVAVGARLASNRPSTAIPPALLPALYIPAGILQFALLTWARPLLGVSPYALFPLGRLCLGALALNAPVSLLTGFSFTLVCRHLGSAAHPPPRGWIAPARVYAWETLGAAVGGAAVTLALARGATEPAIFLIASALALGTAALGSRTRLHACAFLVSAGLPLLALILGADTHANQRLGRLEWSRCATDPAGYAGLFTTAWTRYAYGHEEGQTAFVAGGAPVETFPDTERASALLAMLIAQQPEAQRLLAIGAGAALGRQWNALPDTQPAHWLSPDPSYAPRAAGILKLKNVVAPGEEPTRFLEKAGAPFFDVIVLDLPHPESLAMNRFFTDAFFRAARARLASNGVLAVRFEGLANFGTDVRAVIGASMQATLASVFRHLALKAGDESWWFASDGDTLTESAEISIARWRQRRGATARFPPEALSALFDPERIAFQRASYETLKSNLPAGWLINTRGRPRAGLLQLAQRLAQGGWRVPAPSELARFTRVGPWWMAALLFIAALLRVLYRRGSIGPRAREWSLGDALALVAVMGFSGLALSLGLMWKMQADTGSLFLYVGLASSAYMLGLFLGCRLFENALASRTSPPIVWALGLLMANAAFLILAGRLPPVNDILVFVALFAFAGVLNGAWTPLAGLRMRERGLDTGRAGGLIESADHFGAAWAALLAGLALFPAFGLSMGLTLVAWAVALLAWTLAAGRAQPSTDARRPLGYLLAGLLLAVGPTHYWLNRPEAAAPGDPVLTAFARQVRPGGPVEYATHTDANGRVRPYLTIGEDAALRTSDWADPIRGFGGPFELLVLIDREGRLAAIEVAAHRETPAYFERCQAWLPTLRGAPCDAIHDAFDPDAVSGATYSAQALARALQSAGLRFERLVHDRPVGAPRVRSFAIRPDAAAWTGLVLLIGALILRRYPQRWTRRAWLFAVFLVAGIRYNLQFSMTHVETLLTWQWPGVASGAALLVLVPILVLLLGNIYCGYLCPFGAAQELIGDLRPPTWRFDPDKPAWRKARAVKFVLLGAMTVGGIAFGRNLFARDPLTSVFSLEPTGVVLLFACALLALSFFFERFWCRNLCPAGALLSLLGGVRLLRRWLPAVRPPTCDLGIERSEEADCIQCDRCRARRGMPRPAAWIARRERVTRKVFRTAIGIGVVALFWPVARTEPLGSAGETHPPAQVSAPASDETVTQAFPTLGKPRPVDIQRLETLIREGKLSDREALYYRRIE